MARLPFKTAFLFGSNPPANAIAVFGSLAADDPAFSTDPAVIQSLSQWGGGWTSPTGAVVGTNQPAIEDVMAKDYVDSYFINYLQQIGIVEWDSSGNTPYDKYSVVNGAATTGNYQLYMSLVNNNTSALTVTNAWAKLGAVMTGAGIATAWVVFNGTNATIASSFNVSGVVRNSTGNYTVSFTNELSSATPAISGASGGIVRPVTPGNSSFTFDTAGLVAGAFSPVDYSYVCVNFFSP